MMRGRCVPLLALASMLAACDGAGTASGTAGADTTPPLTRESIRAAALRGDAVRFAHQAAIDLDRGEHEQAAISAHRAIQADPEFAGGHHILAWAAAYLGQKQVQLVSALEAVRLEPDSAAFRRTLGIAYLDNARPNDAERAFLAATALDPDDSLSWLDAARVAHRNGHYAVADSAFDAVERLMPAHFDTATADARLRSEAAAWNRRASASR